MSLTDLVPSFVSRFSGGSKDVGPDRQKGHGVSTFQVPEVLHSHDGPGEHWNDTAFIEAVLNVGEAEGRRLFPDADT